MRRLLVTLAAFTALAAVAAPAFAATRTVVLSAPASGLRYSQTLVHAHAGTITIVFVNHSMLKHNVNVEQGEHEFGKSATINHGTTSFTVTLKAGKYNYYCSVPGHEDAGMHGTLIVA